MDKTTAGPRVRCRKCGNIIQSQHRHDFVTCSCDTVSVDGGDAYLRIVGDLEQAEVWRDGEWVVVG
jgi:hypothetical protein